MKLKKCPICGMPNDKSAEFCDECDHKFIEYYDQEEKKQTYIKELNSYQVKKKNAKEIAEKVEFLSFIHLFWFYLLNLLIILGIIWADNKWSDSINNFFLEKVFVNSSKIDPNVFIRNFQTIKYVFVITLFQLLYNLLLLRNINSKKMILIYNILVIVGLVVIIVTINLLSPA